MTRNDDADRPDEVDQLLEAVNEELLNHVVKATDDDRTLTAIMAQNTPVLSTPQSRRTPHRIGPSGMKFLDSLAPAEQAAFAEVTVERSFSRGSRLMSEGEPADYVMVILSGWAKISIQSSGDEQVVAERGPGQLVGERAALHGNVRSATVTALTDVSALVMQAEDFASFTSAHPRVLEVVEDQIYDRLVGDSAGYAQSSWRDPLRHRAVIDVLRGRPALRSREQPQPLAGENCTVLLTDVVGFGGLNRSDNDRTIIRRAGLEMMRASLGPLWDSCISQDRGDGLLIIVPPQVPTGKIMERVHRELPGGLRLHNRTYSEPARIRLRVAVNVGPVMHDSLGLSGESIIRTARLVEAPVIKVAMAETGAALGIMASEFVYETAVGNSTDFIDAAEYKKVEVSNKEFTGSAWMRLVDQSLPARAPV